MLCTLGSDQTCRCQLREFGGEQFCAAGYSRRWLPRAAWRRLQPRLTRLSALPLRTWPLPALQLAAPYVAAAACPTACPCKEGASEPLRWLLLVAAICAAGCSRRWLPRAAGCLAPLAALPLRLVPRCRLLPALAMQLPFMDFAISNKLTKLEPNS